MAAMAITADIVVVGLGAVGSAALYQAAKLGAKVIGIDRFTPPHDQGSSHGETRITRQAIGEGREFVPLVLRSNEIWEELEAATRPQSDDPQRRTGARHVRTRWQPSRIELVPARHHRRRHGLSASRISCFRPTTFGDSIRSFG